MNVNLGGDRLGSGNKNEIALHNYKRSTHNLSQKWTSSMGSGILYPFLCLPAMRGDKFQIDLEAACRTIPTKGPLFGSYKMQLDVFSVPVRLYQGLLHNNPTRLGMNMKNVYMPQISIASKLTNGTTAAARLDAGKFSNSCLLKYLGLSGMGKSTTTSSQNVSLYRLFNAVPVLGYYDIFKQYYSNKQEENAYVIGVKSNNNVDYEIPEIIVQNATYTITGGAYEITPTANIVTIVIFLKTGTNIDAFKNTLEISAHDGNDAHVLTMSQIENEEYGTFRILGNSNNLIRAEIVLNTENWELGEHYQISKYYFDKEQTIETNESLALKPFKLQNIDDMRMALLSYHTLGNSFKISRLQGVGVWSLTSGTDGTGLPYSTLVATDTSAKTLNRYPLNGLMIKTYQSDLYNNWLDSTLIEGNGSIAQMTAVSTSGGSFTMDALNMAEKLYDLYNRILVSGGTYEDWQNAVYTEMPIMQIEAPIYCGGMSSEVCFEEIVQTAPQGEGDSKTELGTLGGRGVLIKRKGGNVTIKCSEASFIIGIVSLTPRVMYSQGNEFYMTDLVTMDDWHKPALDGIGFQNLIGERLAWWDTTIKSSDDSIQRSTIGKVPAWIEYMTAVDKCYGDFADDSDEGKNFMVLSRRYEPTANGGIADATTYIDPTKFNYAFAYTELEAQNFWVQINSHIIARRLMSAKQIPNL